VSVEPGSRKLLRLEVRNAEVPIERKPPWIKTTLRTGPEYKELKALVRREGLHTVCEEAGCPNIYECWEDREATFLIGGDRANLRCVQQSADPGCHGANDSDRLSKVWSRDQILALNLISRRRRYVVSCMREAIGPRAWNTKRVQ